MAATVTDGDHVTSAVLVCVGLPDTDPVTDADHVVVEEMSAVRVLSVTDALTDRSTVAEPVGECDTVGVADIDKDLLLVGSLVEVREGEDDASGEILRVIEAVELCERADGDASGDNDSDREAFTDGDSLSLYGVCVRLSDGLADRTDEIDAAEGLKLRDGESVLVEVRESSWDWLSDVVAEIVLDDASFVPLGEIVPLPLLVLVNDELCSAVAVRDGEGMRVDEGDESAVGEVVTESEPDRVGSGDTDRAVELVEDKLFDSLGSIVTDKLLVNDRTALELDDRLAAEVNDAE